MTVFIISVSEGGRWTSSVLPSQREAASAFYNIKFNILMEEETLKSYYMVIKFKKNLNPLFNKILTFRREKIIHSKSSLS